MLCPERTTYFSTNCSMFEGMDDPGDLCDQERVALFAIEDRQTSPAPLWSHSLDAMLPGRVVQVISPPDGMISMSSLLRGRKGMDGGMMETSVLSRVPPDGSFQMIWLESDACSISDISSSTE